MDEYIIEQTITKSTGEKIIKQYAKGRLLGKGSDTEVFEVVSLENKKQYAAKIYPKTKLKSSKLKQKLKTEMRIQTKLSHQNIIKFENFFEDTENIYILIELCINKNLFELLRRRKRLTEIEAQCYISQLISGLKYLHSKKIIHRDLRLNNLFLTEKLELKVGDFAYATKVEFDGERKKSICGTPNFMAPEVIDGSHSYEADIWSLGIVLYTILLGKPPFHTDNSQKTYSKIKSGNFSYPENCSISDSAKELINRILIVDFTLRPSLDQILESDFFHQGYQVPKLMNLSTLVAPPSEPREAKDIQEYKEKRETRDLRMSTRKSSAPKKSEKLTPEQFKANVKMTGSIYTGHGADGEVYIKKWIDYTSKYGLGYLMSNGNCGVSYIDSTRMILNAWTSQVFYMDKGNSIDKPLITEYNINEYPDELKKKVSLLQYFKTYLETDTEVNIEESDGKLPVYLKKWMVTKHALIFRLSSKLVQVNFMDHTEITINCDMRVITFVNRKGEKYKVPLFKALHGNNEDVIRRIKYTRDALSHMIKFKS
ncbi:hypothetical protein SteCoe_27858 [Stentor coeruleus]|uniref:Serine/threonine-protein kinase PLK4 n=1 Tax=Stentor coeruleus TaxID=5963 RepID=A0A1R2B9G9_9CILI|nr:hypothetical protein SteCoe_27858 [Stentor coeruleus]